MRRLLFVLAVGLAGYAWKGNLHGFAPPPAPDPAEAMVARLAERLGGQGGSAAHETSTPQACAHDSPLLRRTRRASARRAMWRRWRRG